MSLGPVMLDLVGTEISAAEIDLLKHPQTGGVILFTRNFSSPGQLEALVARIHRLREPYLLVAVDHEGGRVQRFIDGFTRLPPAGKLGELYDSNQRQACDTAYQIGWLMAAELRAVGVDFSFAPVLDIGHGISGVIGDRAYHHESQGVAELAYHVMKGMHDAGMMAVGKHFPGHGGVKEDSHVALPTDTRCWEDIFASDIIPFKHLIMNGIAALMPAHVIYSACDSLPAGFSGFWLRQVLRERLNFQGVIISDDLSMGAAASIGSYAQRAQTALDAGCDMVVICNHPEGAAEVLQALGPYENPVSQARLARMHGQQRTNYHDLTQSQTWRVAQRMAIDLFDDPRLEFNI